MDEFPPQWDENGTGIETVNGITGIGFVLIQEGLQIFADNDPNHERNIKIARAVNNALSSYTELYKEKVRRKRQTTLDELFRKKVKADEEADDDLQGRAEDSSAPPPPSQ
ncbi:putative Tigger transposable element-derived protein 1-like 302 [Homarus americanus]|uniref:Putative Tigger transposable element-derived protein 1-like 302 n=1 Tax=Homarus americanus TaxID=6706 RepID=A0A8J5K913_HOMAM|nr:putative Tigger transposable element-derived protein 1-like 302 [Homarus americanus]